MISYYVDNNNNNNTANQDINLCNTCCFHLIEAQRLLSVVLSIPFLTQRDAEEYKIDNQNNDNVKIAQYEHNKHEEENNNTSFNLLLKKARSVNNEEDYITFLKHSFPSVRSNYRRRLPNSFVVVPEKLSSKTEKTASPLLLVTSPHSHLEPEVGTRTLHEIISKLQQQHIGGSIIVDDQSLRGELLSAILLCVEVWKALASESNHHVLDKNDDNNHCNHYHEPFSTNKKDLKQEITEKSIFTPSSLYQTESQQCGHNHNTYRLALEALYNLELLVEELNNPHAIIGEVESLPVNNFSLNETPLSQQSSSFVPQTCLSIPRNVPYNIYIHNNNNNNSNNNPWSPQARTQNSYGGSPTHNYIEQCDLTTAKIKCDGDFTNNDNYYHHDLSNFMLGTSMRSNKENRDAVVFNSEEFKKAQSFAPCDTNNDGPCNYNNSGTLRCYTPPLKWVVPNWDKSFKEDLLYDDGTIGELNAVRTAIMDLKELAEELAGHTNDAVERMEAAGAALLGANENTREVLSLFADLIHSFDLISCSQAVVNLAKTSKAQSNWWGIKASTAGMIGGSLLSIGLGPVGMVAGASIGGAVALAAGNSVKRRHHKKMDRIIRDIST